jgi:Spy/CpxP family protein refolding chaperone
MFRLKKLFATTVLSATLVLAQRGPGGTPPDPQTRLQHRVDSLATLLTLTADQKARALTIFTDAFTASQTLRTSSQTARTSLAAAVKKNDIGSITQLSTELGTISGQLTAVESKAEAAFYALLTPDQQTRYDATPHRGGPGPEGFGRNR